MGRFHRHDDGTVHEHDDGTVHEHDHGPDEGHDHGDHDHGGHDHGDHSAYATGPERVVVADFEEIREGQEEFLRRFFRRIDPAIDLQPDRLAQTAGYAVVIATAVLYWVFW